MSEKIRHRIGQKNCAGKNLLSFTAWIEQEAIGAKAVYSDAVFIELLENYSQSQRISMAVEASDIRQMVYGMKEIMKRGETKFRKFTDPKLAGGSGPRKELTLGVGKERGFFINLSSGDVKIEAAFDPYAFAALADSLLLLAEETEKGLYYFQRTRN